MRAIVLSAGFCLGLLGAGGAVAADCGGTGSDRVACGCGDVLTRSTVLRRSDPVVVNICPEVGLIIESDRITLDCAGNTLSGDGGGDGIRLETTNWVTIERCRLTGFRDGIQLDDSTNTSIVYSLLYENNSDGINFDGTSNSNFISSNKITNNDEDGIDLDNFSSGNTIKANFFSGNNRDGAGDGIEDCINCTGNKYLFNIVERTGAEESETSGGNGIRIEGSESFLVGNRGNQNANSGLIVFGEGNSLRANTFNNNGQNGICAVEGNRNAGLNRGRNNIGANVAFNVPSCPVGLAPNGLIASAARTTSGLAEPVTDDDDDVEN